MRCGFGLRPVASAIFAVTIALPAAAQINSNTKQSAEATRAQKTNELPRCPRPLGTIAISAPERNWWGSYGLSSPESLIRVYVQQSKCFRLVNRSNQGMAAMSQERNLAASGELQRGGSIGKGQMVQADFTMIPDIVSSNSNKGGTNVGGLLGAFIPGGAGALVSGINIKKKSANVVLNVVNNKSSEEFVSEGQSTKTDLGWGGGGGIFGGGILAAGGASGYDNTEIGQVIALAYLDAYTRLVTDLGGLEAFTAAPQAQKAVTVTRPGRLYASASLKAPIIKPIDAGALLYPTGQKVAGFWEVEDELGTKGWVSEASLAVAR